MSRFAAFLDDQKGLWGNFEAGSLRRRRRLSSLREETLSLLEALCAAALLGHFKQRLLTLGVILHRRTETLNTKEMLNTAHKKSLSNCQTHGAYQIACNLLYITPAKADRWNLSAAAAIGRFETRPSCLPSRLHSFVEFSCAWEFRGILHLLYLVPLQRRGMPLSDWRCTGCSEGHSSWKLLSSWNLKAKSETANLKMHSRTLKTWNINHVQL